MAGRVKLTGVTKMYESIRKEIDETRKKAIRIIKAATLEGIKTMMANTPVWEGVTVANYGVGIGRSGRRSEVAPPGGKAPKNRQARKVDPGETNKMALGAEPRRRAAEAAALSTIKSQLSEMTKLQNVIIFNSSDSEGWDAINNAQWPGGKGQRIRNVAVVSILGEQKIAEYLKNAK